MNEENNQNTPILGSSEGGGGMIHFTIYPSGTYKIKFSDEYYRGGTRDK